MAPSNLQGLNIVHNVPPTNTYLSDADLLSVPSYPDLNAQLDLWTNLNFQSDEPLVSSRPGDSTKKAAFDGKRRAQDDTTNEDDLERYNDADDDRGGIAETHSHENVVMGTVLPPTGVSNTSSSNNSSTQIPPFDINSLLAGFGIDPFMVPPVPVQQTTPNHANTIAQLLSLHASTFRPTPTINTSQSLPPSGVTSSTTQSPVSPSHTSSPASATTTKRARTQRGSISSVTETATQQSEREESATPFTAAEDKRRRNTAASARFRLKKKEREAALEQKAKDLESRVSELERECEGLRRENGWLKGLVVGVTGVGAVQQQQQVQQQSATSVSDSVVSAGVKRSHEDDA